MLGRKKNNKPAPTPEQQLEQRVDAMMDPSVPDQPAEKPSEPSADSPSADTKLPPLDIFGDSKTAPEVPKKLLKQLGADAATTTEASESKPTAADTITEPVAPASADALLDDDKTDQAVDDIVSQEGDTVLEAEDTAARPVAARPVKHSRFHIKMLIRRWWFWVVIVVILIAALAAVPFTRYALAGLVLQKDFSVLVTDSSNHTPISDATVSLAGQQTKTDATGKAVVHVKVGKSSLTVTKQYYRAYSQTVTVSLGSNSAVPVMLVATGRQVPVAVTNAITGQALIGATITVLNTTARTDKSGTAIVVLPAGNQTDTASVSLAGYNTATVQVQVTNQTVTANTFKLVPSGRVYFLSNASGKIDVVKTDLDGSGRQTVVTGTGSEDTNNTVLLPTSDWKYLALLSKRSGGQYAQLYLVSTSDDHLSTIDQGNVNFSPIGWSSHYFIYRADDPNASSWQSGATVIKSYDADTGKVATLVTTTASGTSNANAQYQVIIDTDLMEGKLVYDETWYYYPGNLSVSGQQNTLAWVSADGSNAKTLKSVDAGSLYFSNLKLVQPNQLDFGTYSNSSTDVTYYRLDDSGNVTQSNLITSDTLTQNYPAYLLSPSGNQQFWGDIRDGKHTLFTGDKNAANSVTIATASDYAPYAWYTDSYVLVSKNNSELYVMSANGKGVALKISNYYKPQQAYLGYGGQ